MEVTGMNSSFLALGTVDQFESLIWTDRYDKCGDFELYTPVWDSVLSAVPLGSFLTLRESEHIMITESIEVKTDQETGNHLVISGRSLESMLDWRVVAGQEVFKNANLQGAIQQLLNHNIIAPTDGYRTIPNFIFQTSVDPIITAKVVDAQFYGGSLYTAVQSLCEANGLGFKIVLNATNQFVFSLYVGADRSYSQVTNNRVIFSPKFDNLVNSEYKNTTVGKGNVAFILGEGTGINKFAYWTGIDTIAMRTGMNRRELFVDASDISAQVPAPGIPLADYNKQLDQRGVATLNDSYRTTTFAGAINPVAPFTYQKDFFMGDVLQIENEYAMGGTTRVIEAIYTQNPGQTSVIPTFKSL